MRRHHAHAILCVIEAQDVAMQALRAIAEEQASSKSQVKKVRRWRRVARETLDAITERWSRPGLEALLSVQSGDLVRELHTTARDSLLVRAVSISSTQLEWLAFLDSDETRGPRDILRTR